jgi:hypothetical protein
LTAEQRDRNRRLGRRLVLVVFGLVVFSVAYIIVYARYFKGSA